MMEMLNRTYESTYEPVGKLIVRDGRLFEYTGDDKALKGVWVGIHLGWDDGNLTVEGAQRFVKTAGRKVKIDKAMLNDHFHGQDIHVDAPDGWHILDAGDGYCVAVMIKSGVASCSITKSRLL